MGDWQKVRKVFDAALRHESEERENYIKEACGDDDDLLSEVCSLLSSFEQSTDFLEEAAIAQVADIIQCDTKRFEPGTRFGHYEIIQQIGTGGMGEVYLAQDHKLDRRVAIKTLNEKFSHDESNLKRFVREAKAASALNHPNILVVHEIGESGNAHYIVSEYIEGKTLRDVLSQTPMSLREVLDISIQIANALSAAHSAHLIHRDIKPENVMIRLDGYVRVLDFGLAKLVQEKNKSFLTSQETTVRHSQITQEIILGTVNYMSPEQAKGEELDERTDIFSFGALIYEMIASRTPFAGESTSETFANLINAEPHPLSDFASTVPTKLQKIISKTLRKNRNERYETMQGLLADLMELRANLASSEKPKRIPSPSDKATAIPKTITRDLNKHTAEKEVGFSQQIKRYKWHIALATSLSVIGLAGICLAWYNSANVSLPILYAPFASQKLSTNGKIVHAVISPDGEIVVYTNGIEGKQSIWLRQLKSANNIEIIPPSDYIYGGLSLSPDGKFLYLVRRRKFVEGQGAIYRVSILGGTPTQIIGETEGWISLSPDGEKISFVRCSNRKEDNCSLWIADSGDGRNERRLVSRPFPFRIGDNAFSPDGRSVAFAAGHSLNAANEFSLVEVNINSGVERELTRQKFFDVKSLAWLPKQDGLLITALVSPNKNFRIWQVSVALGEAWPLTKDSENYSALSLNKDATALVSTQVEGSFRLQLLNTENPSAVRVLAAEAKQVAFALDGKVVFSSAMLGNDEIWSINTDGSGQRQLTTDAADDSAPIPSPDNNWIFFVSNRTGGAHVWRMNADGNNQAQITQKEGGYPLFVSPDSKWLYYHHGLHRNLWRVSATGGDEQLVLEKRNDYFAFSPNGLQAAFFEKQGDEIILIIVFLTNGQTIKTFPLPVSKANVSGMAWLPDGKSLAYIVADQEHENTLWQQPLEGGKAQQIGVLGDEEIRSFAIAPDGKNFAIVQGSWRHDMVLLEGLK